MLAFIPVYIRTLGIESYGLIATFATLQVWLALVDVGLRPALAREMARYSGGGHSLESIKSLFFSAEIIGVFLSIVIAACLWVSSSWLSENWINIQSLSLNTASNAFKLMGVMAGLQLLETIYSSSLAGLQRQVYLNVIQVIIVTFRGLGSVIIILWISPTVEAYFIWQASVSVFATIIMGLAAHSSLPATFIRTRFSWKSLDQIKTYALGMLGITILSLLLTQSDKIILARQLPLDDFGQYMLAASVAGALSLLSSPIAAAYFPRMTQLTENGTEAQRKSTFHEAAQITTSMMGAAAAMLVIFGGPLLLLWTSDVSLAGQASGILALLALGTMLNAITGVIYQQQLAVGWTSLTIATNAFSVCIFVPALLIVIPAYGQWGAAVMWLILNFTQVVAGGYFMFRRVLVGSRVPWIFEDNILPLIAVFTVAVMLNYFVPLSTTKSFAFLQLGSIGVCIFISGLLATPLARNLVVRFLINKFPGQGRLPKQ